MQRDTNAVLVGERAAVVKHQDNLKMEGKMESRTTAAVVKGERAEVKRRTDNLKMEGSMQGLVSEAKNASQAIQKVNFKSYSSWGICANNCLGLEEKDSLVFALGKFVL